MLQLKDIIKTEGIIKLLPDDTLSYALAKMRTSHDASFVFDEKNQFLGVINPYYALIKSSYPGNAKVKHCLYHPPKININFPPAKVAGLFSESKVHYLPVFDDNEKFLGELVALLAWSHHRFLWIHPFYDYNGRISRLLNNISKIKLYQLFMKMIL